MTTEEEFRVKYPELERMARARSRISRWTREEIASVMMKAIDYEIPEMVVLTATPLIIRLADSLNQDLSHIGEEVITLIRKTIGQEGGKS